MNFQTCVPPLTLEHTSSTFAQTIKEFLKHFLNGCIRISSHGYASLIFPNPIKIFFRLLLIFLKLINNPTSVQSQMSVNTCDYTLGSIIHSGPAGSKDTQNLSLLSPVGSVESPLSSKYILLSGMILNKQKACKTSTELPLSP